jgi:hypothetical protein
MVKVREGKNNYWEVDITSSASLICVVSVLLCVVQRSFVSCHRERMWLIVHVHAAGVVGDVDCLPDWRNIVH